MKNAKRIYLAIIFVCLAIIGTSIYYVLGGFDKLEVYEFEGINRTVIGKEYIGDFKPKEIGDFILETRTLLDSGELKGLLTIVDYENDTIGSDSSHLFIGASFDEIRNILEIPSGYTFKEFRTSKIYRVFITQHPLVRPLPSDVRSMIEVHSIEKGDVLQPLTFEVYYEDGSLFSEAWVK